MGSNRFQRLFCPPLFGSRQGLVDDGTQRLCRLFQFRQLDCRGCVVIGSQQPRHTQDGIQRCAHVVAHRCQELRFGVAGAFGLALSRGKVNLDPMQTDDHLADIADQKHDGTNQKQ